MNLKTLMTLSFGYFLISGYCFAESRVNKAVEGKEQNKSVEKKRRRKKALSAEQTSTEISLAQPE